MKLILPIVMLALLGCSNPEKWTAFVYPDIENIPGPEKAEAYVIGIFESFDACQVAAVGKVRENTASTGKHGAFICGLNCTYRKDFGGLLVCEEKRK